MRAPAFDDLVYPCRCPKCPLEARVSSRLQFAKAPCVLGAPSEPFEEIGRPFTFISEYVPVRTHEIVEYLRQHRAVWSTGFNPRQPPVGKHERVAKRIINLESLITQLEDELERYQNNV